MFYLFFFVDVKGYFLLLTELFFMFLLSANIYFSSMIKISFLYSFCKLLHSLSTTLDKVLFFVAELFVLLFFFPQDW
jgi:hypothetical protein